MNLPLLHYAEPAEHDIHTLPMVALNNYGYLCEILAIQYTNFLQTAVFLAASSCIAVSRSTVRLY